MEELIPTLQEEGEERIDTLAEQTIIAGVQTINGKAGDLDLKTINNIDLLTPGNINLATPTDIHNLDTAKQDKLVAGANIQIAADGKTISATDTTYSAGSGLNLTGTTFSVDTDTIATQNDIYTLQTTKQDNLTTPQLNAVNSGIDSTKVAQIATNEGDIATINGKIPTQASTSNQLADKNFVNSSVQTATANYRGSWDDWASVPTQASDYPEDYAGSHTPTVNDYMVVQDASDYTEETLEGTWRFKYTGEWDTNGKAGWLPEYQVNETPLTAAQIAAINSGITDTLVAQISTNQSNISDLTTNKLDKNTTFWGQSVQNGAVQGTLTLTESGQNATIATSGHNTADAGIKMGNSKNYVEAGVTEITLSSTTGGIKLKPKSGSSVDVMSSKITNLATPTANTDATTKKYVDDGLAGKQNTLTAGTNIQISGDTISATDTTYSAGTGLTLTGTTFSVNDPAPSGFFTGSATTTSTGTDITLPNALGTTIKDVRLKGDTEQISYTGKNLWGGVSSFSRSISDVDFTTSADGSITVQGTASNTAYSITGQLASQNNVYKTLEAGTYYLSSKDTLPTGFLLQVVSVPSSDTLRDGVGSFTLSAQTSIAVRVRINSGTAITTATTVFPQLELSATKTDYEPYVGGVPSPNPDYPQDIQVVTGKQTVKATGKNLFDWIGMTDKTAIADASNATYNSVLSNGVEVTGNTSTATAAYANSKGWYRPSYSSDNSAYRVHISSTQSVTVSADVTLVTLGFAASMRIYLDGSTAFNPNSDKQLTLGQTVRISHTFNDVPEGDYFPLFTLASNQVKIENIQIELGATATTYEPYQGGSYEINLGKNLFDVSNLSYILDGLYIGNSHSIGGAAATTSVYIPCKPNQTYTVSKTAGKRFVVAYTTDLPAQGVTTAGDITDNEASSITITTGATAKYLVAFVHNTSYDTISKQDMIDSVQIEYGSKATTYSAYFTPIELCKIGTYQDYIYKANGNWYKHAEIEKLVLDGTEGHNISSFHNQQNSINGFRITLGTGKENVGAYKLFSGHFRYDKWSNYNSSSTRQYATISDVNTATGTIYMSQATDTIGAGNSSTSVTSMNTWFASNNAIIYYALATPTDTQITDADLIADLEALADAQLATGQNTITSSTPRPNLDAILTIEAFNNNWNGLSQALLGA